MGAALQRYRRVFREADSPLAALGRIATYLAIRGWALLISCFPIALNLATARALARFWWLLTAIPETRVPRFLRFLARRRDRDRAMENLRFALGDRYSESGLLRIARRSLEHFAQVYLVEAIMTPRVVSEWTWARYIELRNPQEALRQLIAGGPTIMLTGHFGNFELLGYTIARLGVPLTALMRPLDNSLLTDYIERSRKAGGLSLLYKKGAMEAAPRVLDDGGVLCFIADQDAGKKGVFVPFFGRAASWYKSIGLLAMTRQAPIIVGHMVRVRQGFHYRLEVERIIRPKEWDEQPDALRWVTNEFAKAIEAGIRRHPEQYLWMHRRWKSRPPSETRRSTEHSSAPATVDAP